MPRRVANYPDLPPYVTTLNQVSTIGAWILGASTFFFLYNVYKTWKFGEQVTADDPWGWRELPGVGDVVPAAPAQLHLDTAHPVRAPRVRPALSAYPVGADAPGPHRGTPGTHRGTHVMARRNPARPPDGRRGNGVTGGGAAERCQMKVEGYLFIGCATFFGVVDIVYWYFSKDPTGTTALALAVGLAFLTGFYVLFTGRGCRRCRRTTPGPTSARAPASLASSARTAGGRCSWAWPRPRPRSVPRSDGGFS